MIKKIPSILYLWIGQGLSSLGGSVYGLALVWFVLEETQSTLILSTVLIASIIPKIIFSILAGAIGDRFSKKRVLVLLDFLRFLLTLAWGISLYNRTFSLGEVYVFTIIFSIIDAMFHPIYSSLIPELTKGKNLTKIAAINESIFKIFIILAPAISGIAIIYFSFYEFILFNSLTFLLATFATLIIKVEYEPLKITKDPIIQQIRQGMAYFYGDKIIFWSIILIGLANLAVVSYNVNLAALVQKDLNLSSKVYGTVLSCFSFGSLLASFILSIISIKKSRGYIYITCLLIGGSFFTYLMFISTPVGMYICFFFVGFFFSVTSTISTVIIFEIHNEEFRSRILGIASISTFLSPLGLLFWGHMGDYAGYTLAIVIAGGIVMLIAIFGYFTPLKKYN